MTRPWIKFHTSTLDDTRILKLNERQQLRYYQLYLLSGRLNADGLFIENGNRLDETDIAIKLRINDVKQFASDLKALKTAKLIHVNGKGPCIEAFAREQVDWSKKQEQERERQRQHRHGTVTRDLSVTSKPSRARHAKVTPLDQNQTKKKIKKEKKKEIKNQPPPTPSAKLADAKLVGGGSKKSSSFVSFTPDQKQIAEIITPILSAIGLGQKKINLLIPKVTTRIKPADAKSYVLAACASVYSDTEVRNPPIVIAHRITENSVPPVFMTPATWRIIPADVLKVANVDVDRLPKDKSNNNRNDVVERIVNSATR